MAPKLGSIFLQDNVGSIFLCMVETARDHVANAAQLLIAAEDALQRLRLIGNAGDVADDVRELVHAALARSLKAVFLLDNPEPKGGKQ